MAKAKGPPYYRFIRVNGASLRSPGFDKKSDADAWYDELKRKKQFKRLGLLTPKSKKEKERTFAQYSVEWMEQRKISNGANTWKSDDTRLRLHVLPEFGELPLTSIEPKAVKKFLTTLLCEKRKDNKTSLVKASDALKDRVKALMSGIFSQAVEDGLVEFNPVKAVTLKRAKTLKQKIPKKMLQSDDAAFAFIKCAKEMVGLSPQAIETNGRAYVYAALMLMTGPRKSEASALRWDHVDLKRNLITYAYSLEQESKTIIQRTKAGEGAERTVPIPPQLAEILKDWKKITPYNAPSDYVLSKPGGGHMSTRTQRQMHERICKRAKVDVSPHGLRHTFGRLFISKTGNLKALQDILGHSSISTTEIYSKLGAAHLKKFENAMEIQPKNQSVIGLSKGAKRSIEE